MEITSSSWRGREKNEHYQNEIIYVQGNNYAAID